MSYFVKKRLFAQKQIALISFFYFFIKNPIAFLPIFGQEIDKRILSRLYYIMDEKSKACPFFQTFTRNYSSNARILSKTSIL